MKTCFKIIEEMPYFCTISSLSPWTYKLTHTRTAVQGGGRGSDTLKYGDVHEKFIFLETQDLKPLRTGQKHFETIFPNFLPDECKI